MPVGALIGAGFVRISADTAPAEKAIKGLSGIGSLALSSMLTTAVAPLVAGIGAIAVSYAAAGAAAGAFALAVKPQFTAITNASKQYAAVQQAQTKAELASEQARKLSTTGGKAYTQALANQAAAQKKVSQAQDVYKQTLTGMPPATAATAVAYAHLTDATQKWSDSLAPKTMPIFTKGLELIQSLLPKLTPIVSGASDVLMSFMNNLGAGTSGKVFEHFGTDLASLSSGALGDFLQTVKNLATGFIGILDAFTPMASTVTGGLTKLTGKFADWGATAGTNSGVQKFFQMARDDAPGIGHALEAIANAASHIAGGLGPLSGIGLKVAEALASILNALPVPVLNQVVNAVVAVNLAMKAYAVYSAAAAAATWLFSTATGASRVQLFFLNASLGLTWVQLRLMSVWSGITTAAQWLWNTSLVSGTVSVISSTASMIARNVALAASATATGVITAATWLWTAALSPAIAAVWAMTTALLANPITWVVVGILALIAVIVLIALKTTWFETAWKYTWNAVVAAASWAWGQLMGGFHLILSLLTTVGNAFTWLWTNAIEPALRFIVVGFLDMAGSVLKGAAYMLGWMPGLGPALKSAVKEFNVFRDGVNAALGGVKPKTVPVTISFNGVPQGQITGHTYTSTTGFSYAQGGQVRGPGTGTSDQVPIMASNGEFVVNAAATSRHLPLLRSINARKFATGGMVGFTNASARDMALADRMDISQQTTKIVADYVKANNAYIAKLGATLGGSIPVGNHLAVINAAMAAAGVPPPGTVAQWQTGLNTLIGRESGWNPNAINLTDSNALAGHPSQGLAQTIPGTFNAYHVAGTSSNILDPVANVAAAIRYIVSTYGNITNVQQANASLPPQGYDVGGWLMPGKTLAVNKTGRPERVLGPHESMGNTFVFNFSGPVGSQAELQNWTVNMLTALKQRGRLRGLVGT